MKKLFDKIYVTVLCCVLAALSVSIFILPDKSISEKENRALVQRPKVTVEKLFSGEYTSELGNYLADQFPFRDGFVGLKAYFELAQLKGENNGVIYTNSALINRRSIEDVRIEENLKSIEEFANNTSLPVTVAPIPCTVDVFSEYLPKSYPVSIDKALWETIYDASEARRFSLTDLYDSLCSSNAYYHTDHHYTVEGAYIAYKNLGDSLGYTPYDEDYFTKEWVADDFCGTAMRTSGFYLFPKDRIVLYRYSKDTEYTVIADGKSIPLYDFDKLKTTDKYAVFLGGNHARVDITDGSKQREKLLVIRDSFADSIAPFLALHYDLTLIDLRYFTDSVAQLSVKEGIDKVLVLESIEELSTSKNLSYLRMK